MPVPIGRDDDAISQCSSAEGDVPELTQHDIETIALHPLAPFPHGRDILGDASWDPACPSARDPMSQGNLSQLDRAFLHLVGSDASLLLASRTGRGFLSQDLLAVLQGLHTSRRGTDCLLIINLVDAVYGRRSCVTIWGYAVAVVKAVLLPSPSTPHLPRQEQEQQPQEQQQKEQVQDTKGKGREVEADAGHDNGDIDVHSQAGSKKDDAPTLYEDDQSLLDELDGCTWKDTRGFHKKYFQDKAWNTRSNKIWRRMKRQYDSKRRKWTFPSTAETEEHIRCQVAPVALDQDRNYNNGAERSNRASGSGSRNKDADSDKILAWIKLFFAPRPPSHTSHPSSKSHSRSHHSPRRCSFILTRGRAREDPISWQSILANDGLGDGMAKTRDELWLSLLRGIRDAFASQPTRLFFHAFTLYDNSMECWVFDHSGAYSGGDFCINTYPERFVRSASAYWLMGDEEMGHNMIIKRNPEGNPCIMLWTSDSVEESSSSAPSPTTPRQKKMFELKATPSVVTRKGARIVGRATHSFFAKVVGSPGTVFDTMVKFSWAVNTRPSESGRLIEMKERGVSIGGANGGGIQELRGFDDKVCSIGELRKGLTFMFPYRGRSMSPRSEWLRAFREPKTSNDFRNGVPSSVTPAKRRFSHITSSSRAAALDTTTADTIDRGEGGSSRDHSDSPSISADDSDDENDIDRGFQDRELRVLATTYPGPSIKHFRTPSSLVAGLRAAIRAHYSLYEDGGVLHRDITADNIFLSNERNDGGRIDGALVARSTKPDRLYDFYSNGHNDGEEEGQYYPHPPPDGKKQFMALSVLCHGPHAYVHDMESFFYVLVWLCARHGWALEEEIEDGRRRDGLSSRPVARGTLCKWALGTHRDTARAKEADLTSNKVFSEHVLAEFPPGLEVLKPLCARFAVLLFGQTLEDRKPSPWQYSVEGTGDKAPGPLFFGVDAAFEQAIEDLKSAGMWAEEEPMGLLEEEEESEYRTPSLPPSLLPNDGDDAVHDGVEPQPQHPPVADMQPPQMELAILASSSRQQEPGYLPDNHTQSSSQHNRPLLQAQPLLQDGATEDDNNEDNGDGRARKSPRRIPGHMQTPPHISDILTPSSQQQNHHATADIKQQLQHFSVKHDDEHDGNIAQPSQYLPAIQLLPSSSRDSCHVAYMQHQPHYLPDNQHKSDSPTTSLPHISAIFTSLSPQQQQHLKSYHHSRSDVCSMQSPQHLPTDHTQPSSKQQSPHHHPIAHEQPLSQHLLGDADDGEVNGDALVQQSPPHMPSDNVRTSQHIPANITPSQQQSNDRRLDYVELLPQNLTAGDDEGNEGSVQPSAPPQHLPGSFIESCLQNHPTVYVEEFSQCLLGGTIHDEGDDDRSGSPRLRVTDGDVSSPLQSYAPHSRGPSPSPSPPQHLLTDDCDGDNYGDPMKIDVTMDNHEEIDEDTAFLDENLEGSDDLEEIDEDVDDLEDNLEDLEDLEENLEEDIEEMDKVENNPDENAEDLDDLEENPEDYIEEMDEAGDDVQSSCYVRSAQTQSPQYIAPNFAPSPLPPPHPLSPHYDGDEDMTPPPPPAPLRPIAEMHSSSPQGLHPPQNPFANLPPSSYSLRALPSFSYANTFFPRQQQPQQNQPPPQPLLSSVPDGDVLSVGSSE
ncbi:hypothetical protein N3K66_000853 [Trichothecium roseum]|uniref:Uncharacterized protein n=1 Tax=Trichothecium roseum TaxID=47278 RepID=A0ACC0VDE6_9HYPO|nr:hypothetical protein N3K66_000853 [Trichothecium roseum]